MDKQIILQEIAISDLESIAKYYIVEVNNKRYLISLITAIRNAITQLQEMPYLGTLVQEQPYKALGIRKLIIEKYIIFYKVSPNAINILRILSMRQQWQEYL